MYGHQNCVAGGTEAGLWSPSLHAGRPAARRIIPQAIHKDMHRADAFQDIFLLLLGTPAIMVKRLLCCQTPLCALEAFVCTGGRQKSIATKPTETASQEAIRIVRYEPWWS